MRCKSLDKALIEILAGFEKVDISLLPLALLYLLVLLTTVPVLCDDLAVAGIDFAMYIPQVTFDLLSGGVFNIQEDGDLTCYSQPDETESVRG